MTNGTYLRIGRVVSTKVVSSVRVAIHGGHAHLTIWNRGGNAGSLTVDRADAEWFVDALIPPDERESYPDAPPAPEGTDGK